MTTNLPFLRWLVAHPVLRAGAATTAFLVEHPPLSAPPAALPDPVWRGAFRLNLPGPAPMPPPDVDAAAHAHGTADGVEHDRRADAGHRDQGERSGGLGRQAPATRSSCSRR